MVRAGVSLWRRRPQALAARLEAHPWIRARARPARVPRRLRVDRRRASSRARSCFLDQLYYVDQTGVVFVAGGCGGDPLDLPLRDRDRGGDPDRRAARASAPRESARRSGSRISCRPRDFHSASRRCISRREKRRITVFPIEPAGGAHLRLERVARQAHASARVLSAFAGREGSAPRDRSDVCGTSAVVRLRQRDGSDAAHAVARWPPVERGELRRMTEAADHGAASISGRRRRRCSSARCSERGIEVIGLGTAPSRGLRKGVVVNVESTVQAIRKAVARGRGDGRLRDPQRHRQHRRRPHPRLQQPRRGARSGTARCRRRHRAACSTRRAPWRCRSTARSCTSCRRSTSSTTRTASRSRSAWPACGSRPRSTSSPRRSSAAQNVVKCCKRPGSVVDDVVLGAARLGRRGADRRRRRTSASRWSTSAAGTTDVVVFHGGAVRHTAVPAARRQPPHQRHRRRPADADRRGREDQAALRLRARRRSSSATIEIEVPSVGGPRARACSRATSSARSSSRASRRSSRWSRARSSARATRRLLASGVVLIGGTALLDGITDVAEQVLRLPVRIGVPAARDGARRSGQRARSTRPRSACCSPAATAARAGAIARRARRRSARSRASSHGRLAARFFLRVRHLDRDHAGRNCVTAILNCGTGGEA